MAVYEAASARRELVVRVGPNGATTGVQLHPAAMTLSDQELASRIVRLNALAYLRRQVAISEGHTGDHVETTAGSGFVPSAAQVATYARTLDF
jgi:hypothetical protein